MPLMLSLFPGIGLLDMAFELEGFCVVRGPDVLWGGDIRRFNPPAGRFDGVIGGPPCQAFSRLAHMVRQNGYEPKFGNQIPEFERVVNEAQPAWFVMEEVPDAPTPHVEGYETYSTLLNNRQCIDDDGKPAAQNRIRRWTFGRNDGGNPVLLIDTAALESLDYDYAATGGSHGPGGISRECDGSYSPEAQERAMARKRGIPIMLGGSGNRRGGMSWNSKSKDAVAELCRKQGLPETFLDDSPFTVAAKCKAIGNGVPIPMGRAIARAVREATEGQSKWRHVT